MVSKVALITGITGQDGSYLADLLLEKVPVSLLITFPSSNTPTCSHIPISLRIAPSLTRFCRIARR